MAGLAATVFENLIAFQFISSQSRIIPAQPPVKPGIRGNKSLFKRCDGLGHAADVDPAFTERLLEKVLVLRNRL